MKIVFIRLKRTPKLMNMYLFRNVHLNFKSSGFDLFIHFMFVFPRFKIRLTCMEKTQKQIQTYVFYMSLLPVSKSVSCILRSSAVPVINLSCVYTTTGKINYVVYSKYSINNTYNVRVLVTKKKHVLKKYGKIQSYVFETIKLVRNKIVLYC